MTDKDLYDEPLMACLENCEGEVELAKQIINLMEGSDMWESMKTDAILMAVAWHFDPEPPDYRLIDTSTIADKIQRLRVKLMEYTKKEMKL